MRNLRAPLHVRTTLAGLCALAFLLYGPTVPPAPAQASDPVEQLRQALPSQIGMNDNPAALKYRDKLLKEAIANLKTPSDLRRALALTEWKDNDKLNTKVRDIDLAARTQIGQRLETMLQTIVNEGDSNSRIALAIMLGEIGITIRALELNDPNSLGRRLSPLLLTMLKNDFPPPVRQAAARALGKVNTNPQWAMMPLKSLLESTLVQDRRAAAEALPAMVTTVFQLQRKGRAQTGVEALREDVVAVGTDVVPVAGICVKDSDPLVRRFGLDAIYQTAAALNNLIPDPIEPGILPPHGRDPKGWLLQEKKLVEGEQERLKKDAALFQPLLEALQAQGEALAAALADSYPEARVLSRRALEMMGSARLRLLRREESVPLLPGEEAPKVGDKGPIDPLALAIKPGLLEIAKRAVDPDVRVRRATLDFLEALEDGAAPAVPILVVALRDDDRFIRWAAARTLGKVGPVMPETTVPAMARLLAPREDPDVREAVTEAFRRYGPAARASLPALIGILNFGDAVTREAVIRAVISVGGSEAVEAIPALRQALKTENANVRRAAAEALGNLGAHAMAAIDDLRDRLTDDDADVRIAASEAILNILRPRLKL